MGVDDLLQSNCLGIGLDDAIYRILPVSFLTQDVANGTLTLRRVIAWEDTHEAAYFRRELPAQTGELVGMEELSKDWFGQCWSRRAESDAMWRIYNPDGASVRIETTPRALMTALFQRRIARNPSFADSSYISLYVGEVTYHAAKEFERLMATPAEEHVLQSSGVGIAKMLCAKRDPFQHESEIRLLYHAHVDTSSISQVIADADLMSTSLVERHRINGRDQQLPGFIHLPFDWSCITNVMLGPRVNERTAASVRAQVQCALPGAGWSASDLYGPPRYLGTL